MKVSTKLFNQQQLKQFSSTTEELQDLQNKISTGQNILKASDDPVGAVELSGLEVVKKQIEQYERNVNSASNRLSLLENPVTFDLALPESPIYKLSPFFTTFDRTPVPTSVV